MRPIILAALLVAPAAAPPPPTGARVLDNAQVRVFETTGPSFTAIDHGAGVIVCLDDTPEHKAGDAFWAADVASAGRQAGRARVAIVVPKARAATAAPGSGPGSKPGDAPFTGMSFRTLFENDRVAVIRARMDVGAREAFHTHASDTVVVHLSGGSIEDTADGTTKVNRWKHGDIEFEARGSSHAARNVGDAVDVVLVTLKPQPASR